jgi:hypothetical protein
VLGFLNTKVALLIIKLLNPTLNQNVNDTLSLPFPNTDKDNVKNYVKQNIALSRADWDSFETSWDFAHHPLIEYNLPLAAFGDTREINKLTHEGIIADMNSLDSHEFIYK